MRKHPFPQPTSPGQVNTTLRQDLSGVLKGSRPLVPETVILHNNQAVHLDAALDNLAPSPEDALPQDGTLPYLRPKRVTTYRMFYNSKRGGRQERR